MHSHVIHAFRAAILLLYVVIAAACNSSPVDVDSRSLVQTGTFSVSPLHVDFGRAATSASLTVTNNGTTSLTWTAGEKVGWLALVSTSGTIPAKSSKTLGLMVNRAGKSSGGYSTYVNFSAGAAGSAKIMVSMTVPSTFSFSPIKIEFGSTATSATATLTNSGTTSITWTASEGEGWLALGSTSGTIPAKSSKTLGLKVSRIGKPAGGYATYVSFSAGTAGSANLPVSMIIPSTVSIDVAEFGARGDDLTDDSPAFRRALSSLPSTGGVLTIPAGTYYLRPIVGIDNIDSGLELLSRTNVTIAGAGMDQTILRMVAAPYSGDTHIVVLDRVQQVTLRDLTLDGNVPAASYSDEQSHGVEVRSGSNIRFENVRIMRTHGDGIRLLGIAKSYYSWVDQVSVLGCWFETTGRSGVGIQRGVRGVTITGSTFTKVADQAVSMEPSSTTPNTAARDIVVASNRFFNMSPIAIAIVGLSEVDPARNVRLIGNTLEQTTIRVLNADGIYIENNVLYGSNQSPIRIQKASRDIWIVGNLINDEAAFHGESSVVLAYDSPFAPTDVHFIGNTVRSGRFTGFYARDSEHLEITGNVFTGTGPAGVFVSDVVSGSPLADFYVAQNQIMGYSVGVRFHSAGDLLSQVCSEDNAIWDYEEVLKVSGPVSLSC